MAALETRFGGQAVIEGVMMRGPRVVAVAVRRPDNDIAVRREAFRSWGQAHPWLRWPLLRGVAALGEALILGVRALFFSANEAVGQEEELGRGAVALTLVVSLAAGVGIFVLLPTWASGLLRPMLPSGVALNLVEGTLRLGILLGYLAGVSRLPDIRRVFEYHGAEHKVIHAVEAGEPLTVERVRRFSIHHPRCGTSFLLLVAVVTVFLFAFFGWPPLWERLAIRVLLLPVVAGVAFELLKLSAASSLPVLRQLAAPGMWLQRWTTREPDDAQLEVAIRALEGARDPL
ncbi:MAG: DUF1385 domain-containing protein [Thermaerobacter sp.]|nr:DUF1385 domain-containing protein [Thermaerobacter sp.]